MANVRSFATAALGAALLSSCAGGGSAGSGTQNTSVTPPTGGASAPTSSVQNSTSTAVPKNAPNVTITEYFNSNYFAHGGITLSKDGSVWFDSSAPGGRAPFNLVHMQGKVDTPTSVAIQGYPAPFALNSRMLSTPGGRILDDALIQEEIVGGGPLAPDDVLIYARAGATMTLFQQDLLDAGTATAQSLAMDAVNGQTRIWYVAPSGASRGAKAGNFLIQTGLGPSGDLSPDEQATVVVIDARGNHWTAGEFPIPHWAFQGPAKFDLPSQVNWVSDAVSGPDHAIWFVDGKDSLVGRMTLAGAITIYHTLTPNANPLFITAGGDGALWFTEFNASKIGRITTSGQMTEYTLPTAKSGPYQIVGPATAGCAPSQLWVAEQSSGKIAQVFITP